MAHDPLGALPRQRAWRPAPCPDRIHHRHLARSASAQSPCPPCARPDVGICPVSGHDPAWIRIAQGSARCGPFLCRDSLCPRGPHARTARRSRRLGTFRCQYPLIAISFRRIDISLSSACRVYRGRGANKEKMGQHDGMDAGDGVPGLQFIRSGHDTRGRVAPYERGRSRRHILSRLIYRPRPIRLQTAPSRAHPIQQTSGGGAFPVRRLCSRLFPLSSSERETDIRARSSGGGSRSEERNALK